MLYLQYILISAFLIAFTKLTQKARIIGWNQNAESKNISWWIEWLLLTNIYAIRLVDGTAGADSVVYKEAFENREKIFSEYLFQKLNFIVRDLTNSYHIFFFVIYGIFVFGLLFFAKEIFDKNEKIVILFLYFSMYITAFGVIRQWVGIGIGMIAYTLCVKKEYVKGLIVAFIGIGIHHTMLVYFVLILMFVVVQRLRWKIDYRKMLFAGVIINIGFMLLRAQFINFMRNTEYVNYVSDSALSEFSWLGYIPAIVLMIIVLIFSRDILHEDEKYELGVFFLFANFAMIFATVMLGMSRLYTIFFPIRIHMISALRRIAPQKINLNGNKVGIRAVYDAVILFDGTVTMWRVINASALPYIIDWSIFY